MSRCEPIAEAGHDVGGVAPFVVDLPDDGDRAGLLAAADRGEAFSLAEAGDFIDGNPGPAA